ncbi:MAG: hypothetical protein P4L79_10600 [Legionella sp.]|uniref:hypothetical protein n=1 Tax=Legionella sp. TaxID=459 RepID=UPI00283ED17F|nr:hypothetical protein [Legionella sp.]
MDKIEHIITFEDDKWEKGDILVDGIYFSGWCRMKKIESNSRIEFNNPLYGVPVVECGDNPSEDYYDVTAEYPLKDEFKEVYPEMWEKQEKFPILKGE